MANIHPTAVIAPGARIHSSCEIGPYAVIGPHVTLAPGNVVGPHVVLDGVADIGAGNRFLASCAIGASPQIIGRVNQAGRLIIADGNVFREFVTVHSGGEATTRIGSRGLFMATAHVAHDCQIGDDVIMANGATLAGHVQVGDAAQLSGLCAIHQHVRIGALAFVAGGAIATQDVAPYCLVQGDRARLVSLNLVGLRRAGLSPDEILRLKRVFRELFHRGGALTDRLAAAQALDGDARAQTLIDFVRSSLRGVIAAPRRSLSAAA
ncbi:MAG TPA: acyl-ACP--UDP-N-acetylglucosamine O-acyltransferase [Phenylobacterium sp.]|uniref:acyl-ACP--UDP-N-acetylglucosamine O-acyltransferase n=1 Tax=Phenylobacterium sp. TaxID=1871053 RepID=UPI002F95B6BF